MNRPAGAVNLPAERSESSPPVEKGLPPWVTESSLRDPPAFTAGQGVVRPDEAGLPEIGTG